MQDELKPLEDLVRRFAQQMLDRVRDLHRIGKRGWDNPANESAMREALLSCAQRGSGQEIDAANFCAFLWGLRNPGKRAGFVVIDTEGSGLFDKRRAPTADGQPRLAELAMVMLDADLNEEGIFQAYVKPDGWSMTEGASEVNGLLDAFLEKNGRDVREVLQAFHIATEEGRTIVGHNLSHDLRQLRAEYSRAGWSWEGVETRTQVCTMHATTELCQLPGKFGGYKWPKLAEACERFGIDLVGAHTALGDARACADLLRSLRACGRLS